MLQSERLPRQEGNLPFLCRSPFNFCLCMSSTLHHSRIEKTRSLSRVCHFQMQLLHLWSKSDTKGHHLHLSSSLLLTLAPLRNQNTRFNTLQHTATYSRSLHHDGCKHTATRCNTLRHAATRCNMLQHTAAHHSILRHTATRCNTLAPAAS